MVWMPTRASIHKQGMAKEHEPAAANATRKGGPRMDNESEVHHAAPADRESAKKATLLPLSIGHQRGGRRGNTTNTSVPASATKPHRHGQAHHGMARRVKSVRRHVGTSAKTGMLYAAQWRTQPQRSWCQRGYSMLHGDRTKPPKAHIPPSFLCLTGPNKRERRAGKERGGDTHQGRGRGKIACQGEGRANGE